MLAPSKPRYADKIKPAECIRALIGRYPRKKTVVMCHGVFDIVHPGHLRHLRFAKDRADILIVSVTADRHIRKGNIRPHVPAELRAENLAAFEMVDYVIVDDEPSPLKNIALLQPDFFAKGFEYSRSGLAERTKEERTILDGYGGEILFTPGDVVYSSSALLDMSPPNLAVDTLLVTMRTEGITFDDLRKALDAIAGTRVHVVGDTIVDTVTHCAVIGGMTKTPTMSVKIENVDRFVGGAGVVAKHLAAAGASVSFSTVVGNDANGAFVVDDLTSHGITVLAEPDTTRPTTHKNAIEAGGYRLLKVDTVDNRPVSSRLIEAMDDDIRNSNADAVVFCDFRHGIFNRDTIPVLQSAIPAGAFTAADSQVASRWGNILEFVGFDLITPNEREARFALGDQDSVIRPLAARLFEQAQCKAMILKLGERGSLVYRGQNNGEADFHAVGAFADRVVDAVGTGDAMLAYAMLVTRATGSNLMGAILGSFAAAVACEHEGNIPVGADDVRGKIDAIEAQAHGS